METKVSKTLYRLFNDLHMFNNYTFKYIVLHRTKKMIGPIPGITGGPGTKLYKIVKFKDK